MGSIGVRGTGPRSRRGEVSRLWPRNVSIGCVKCTTGKQEEGISLWATKFSNPYIHAFLLFWTTSITPTLSTREKMTRYDSRKNSAAKRAQ